MPGFDIFNADPFTLTSLTEAVQGIPYEPMLLGSMNLFLPRPITTLTAGVERKNGVLTLIQTSERGSPFAKDTPRRANVRDFRTVRLGKTSTIHSHELIGMRAFGTESDMQTVQAEVAMRMADLTSDLNVTVENHKLGAVQGIVLDADGSTIYNYFTEFGISQPSEITFSNAAVTSANGMIPFIDNNIVRPMARALGGLGMMRPAALCGDQFFDWFTQHADVRDTYKNWQAAETLRESKAFTTFPFGGVDWVNYRGTDDNSTVAISTAKAKFFPTGVRGLFQEVLSPGESMEMVGTRGQERYAQMLRDPSGRDAFIEVEVSKYPLFMCTRPEVLLRGVAA